MMGSITNIILLMFFILFFYTADAEKPLVHSSSNSRCIESERKALLEFKASLLNDMSGLSSWTGLDCCSWDGITCHNLTGHVQVLQLGEYTPDYFPSPLYDFNSPLSPWLFNLTHLEALSMDHSGLTGPIPNMFDKLTSLIHLDLSENPFESAVFPDSLCGITSLTYIDLSTTNLYGSLPSCLANLTSLTYLDVGDNTLSGEIPGGLGNLSHLTTLDLSFSLFNSSIPSSFGNLRDLEILHLESNKLSGAIPSTLGKLTKLVRLYVSDNSLMGELSESFFDGLISLKKLEISKNHHLVFNVSPQWIPPFQLLYIGMESIFIGTQFPPWLQTQTDLIIFRMRNASIYGAIPDWFQTAFRNLAFVVLSENLLTGPLPTFDNASLEGLLLSGNQFSGNIPEQYCNSTSLKSLSLANNQLTGTIPLCMGNLRSLRLLDLGRNSLSGCIPNEFVSLNQLSNMHLNGNKLTGELPTSLWNLTSLTTLDLGDNQLQGSIPQWIGNNLSSLQYLRLDSNNFSGEIPVSICQLPSLQILNLASNNLVGTIPPCIENLIGMLPDIYGDQATFDFYDDELLNIFKGRKMEYTSSLPYAKFISLSGNHLHGNIPIELMNLKGLQSLNLSNNELTGIIPETINNLEHLESLDLSMNRLSGTIPQSLANIDDLSYLNLSFNNLAGKVPSGNHFDTLDDPSIYQGNRELCGKILMKSCPGDDDSTTSNVPNGHVSDADDDLDHLSWMYAGIGPGFTVGFLAVICVLFFNDEWRIAYFGFADNVYNKARVTCTINFRSNSFCF